MGSGSPETGAGSRRALPKRQAARAHLSALDGPARVDDADGGRAIPDCQPDDTLPAARAQSIRDQRPDGDHACPMLQEHGQQGAGGTGGSWLGSRSTGRADARAEGNASLSLHPDRLRRRACYACDEGVSALATSGDPAAEGKALNGSYQSRQRLTATAAGRRDATLPPGHKPLKRRSNTRLAVALTGIQPAPIATSCVRRAGCTERRRTRSD